MSADFRLTALAAARAPERNPRRNSQATVTRVAPELLEAALRAAGGDASRLHIISATEIIVTNRRRA